MSEKISLDSSVLRLLFHKNIHIKNIKQIKLSLSYTIHYYFNDMQHNLHIFALK